MKKLSALLVGVALCLAGRLVYNIGTRVLDFSVLNVIALVFIVVVALYGTYVFGYTAGAETRKSLLKD